MKGSTRTALNPFFAFLNINRKADWLVLNAPLYA
jgi:hypothetical protein